MHVTFASEILRCSQWCPPASRHLLVRRVAVYYIHRLWAGSPHRMHDIHVCAYQLFIPMTKVPRKVNSEKERCTGLFQRPPAHRLLPPFLGPRCGNVLCQKAVQEGAKLLTSQQPENGQRLSCMCFLFHLCPSEQPASWRVRPNSGQGPQRALSRVPAGSGNTFRRALSNFTAVSQSTQADNQD